MAYTKLVFGISQTNAASNVSTTFSTTNTSYAFAQQQVQNLTLQNGVWADNGLWYPLSAIFWVQPQ